MQIAKCTFIIGADKKPEEFERGSEPCLNLSGCLSQWEAFQGTDEASGRADSPCGFMEDDDSAFEQGLQRALPSLTTIHAQQLVTSMIDTRNLLE